MILAFAFSALTLGPGQAPAQMPVPAVLTERVVSMVVQTSATHFAAENLGAQLQLILVGEPGFGAMTSVTLTPGQRIEHVLPAKASGSLWIEILERTQTDWIASGAFPLLSIESDLQGGNLWIEQSPEGLRMWAVDDSEQLEPSSTSGRLASGGIAALLAPHVPGAPPANKGGDTPPKVPDKTLPPF